MIVGTSLSALVLTAYGEELRPSAKLMRRVSRVSAASEAVRAEGVQKHSRSVSSSNEVIGDEELRQMRGHTVVPADEAELSVLDYGGKMISASVNVGEVVGITCANEDCETLGWGESLRDTTICGSSTSAVCGASNTAPLQSCSGVVNWDGALAFCRAAGARLCTIAELEAEEVGCTGCGYNQVEVWSSSGCQQGYFTYYRGDESVGNLIQRTTCYNETSLFYARCCADLGSKCSG